MAINYPTRRKAFSPPRYDYQPRGAPPMNPPANDNPPRGPGRPGVPVVPGGLPPTLRRFVRRQWWSMAARVGRHVVITMMTTPREYHSNGWLPLYGPAPIPPEYDLNEGWSAIIGPGPMGMTVAGDRHDWLAAPDPSWMTAGHWIAGEVWGPGAGIRHYTDVAYERDPAVWTDLLPEVIPEGTVILPEPEPMPEGAPQPQPQPDPDRRQRRRAYPFPSPQPQPSPRRREEEVERRLDPWRSRPGETPPLWPLPWQMLPLRVNTPWRQAGNNVLPIGHTDPWVDPVHVVQPVNGPVIPIKPEEFPARPPEGTKERKINTKTYLLMRVVNAVTEGVDLVESAWDALPRSAQTRVKGKKTTAWQKMQDVYRNIDKIDGRKFVKNVILNEIEDRFFGKIGRINAKLARRLRPHGELPIGYQTGGWDTPPRVYLER